MGKWSTSLFKQRHYPFSSVLPNKHVMQCVWLHVLQKIFGQSRQFSETPSSYLFTGQVVHNSSDLSPLQSD